MKANAVVFQDNIATLRAVNAGQVDGGVIYHYYWFRDQAGTKEISGNTALHYFRNQDPARSSPSPAAAFWNPARRRTRHRSS